MYPRLKKKHCTIVLLLLTLLCACSKVKTGKKDPKYSVLKSVYDRANKMYDEGFKEASNRYFDSAYASLKNVPPIGKYFRYARLSTHYSVISSYDSARLYADSALRQLEYYKLNEKYPDEYLNALFTMSNALCDTREYNKAFDLLLKAKQYAIRHQSLCMLNTYSHSLGLVLYRQTEYSEALVYFRQALREIDNCNSNEKPYFRIQELINNMALCHSRLKHYDSALYYYRECLQYMESHFAELGAKKIKEAKGVTYTSIGELYALTGQLDSAEIYLRNSLDINMQPHSDYLIFGAVSLSKLSEVYFQEKRLPAMRWALDSLRSSLSIVPDDVITKEMYFGEYLYHKERGDLVSALSYFQQYVAQRDSIRKSKENNYNLNALKEMRAREQQYLIDILKKDNELNKMYLWIAVGFSIMTILIIILIYQSYKKGQTLIEKLSVLNNKINQQKQLLKQSNEEKDRILYFVAHDLRSPINGISYLTDLSLVNQTLPDDIRENITMMRKAARDAQKLTNELLSINLGNPKGLKKTENSLSDIIRDTTSIMRVTAADKQQQIMLDVPEEDIIIFADAEKIARVVTNILENAVKFSHEGGTIQVALSLRNNKAEVSIKDNGIGIPKELQPDIFHLFTKAGRTGTRGEKSFGIGLSLCKQLIEIHDGEIWVESQEGSGTVFHFTLPVVRAMR